MGNPAEPYGLWGMLDDATAGGHFQFFLGSGADDADITVTWDGIAFEDLGGPVAIEESTWGGVKALYR
jgi:hypothetical protein